MRFLPHRSERIPAGMLIMIPVNEETAATIPTPDGSAPSDAVNRGSTGLLAIVELKMAKSPVAQSIRNGFIIMIIEMHLSYAKQEYASRILMHGNDIQCSKITQCFSHNY
jgi:hypothetical protein